MKKLLLFSLAVLMATLAARADVVINATNFPDANFRAYLLNVYPSGTITTAQLATHETMLLENKNISSLEGIRYFTGLKHLECSVNSITSLDLSNNKALTYLNCSSNQLTELDVAGMSHLERLNVADNPQLEVLLCYSCNLKQIYMHMCPALYDIQCFDNPELSSIGDIYECSALRYFDGENCGLTQFNCWSMPTLTTLNLANNPRLKKVQAFKCNLTSLNVSECDSLEMITCYQNKLTNLDLSDLSALKEVYCYDNMLTSLNIDNCVALEVLNCSDNKVTALAFTGCYNLQNVNVDNNQLTSLKLVNRSQLTRLSCINNQLTRLLVPNCTALKSLYCQDNQITSLNPLQCTALETLRCYNNQLASMDLSTNTALKELNCYNNQLTSLDLSACTALTSVDCGNNQLTDLDVTNCPLNGLNCGYNQLTSLDLSTSPTIKSLLCNDNQLTSLDLTNCDQIEDLYCYHNKLQGEAIDYMINSLPTWDYEANWTWKPIGMIFPYPEEGNIFTNTQAMTAYNKGWYLDKYIEEENYFYPWFYYQMTIWDDTVAAGSTFTLPIYNLMADEISSYQFDLYLPDGYNLVNVETGAACDEQAFVGYQQSDQYNNGRRYRRVMLSNANVTGYYEDPVVIVTLQASASAGKAYISLENQKVNGPSATYTDWYNSYAMITVENGGSRGDVNNDGNVNISDVTALINYLLSNNATGLNLDAANCNQDNTINISDVTTLINFLLSGNWPASKALAPRALPRLAAPSAMVQPEHVRP